MELPHFEGWYLIGAFPDNEPDDVGSWWSSTTGKPCCWRFRRGYASGT